MHQYFAHGTNEHEGALQSSSHFLQEPYIAIPIITVAIVLLGLIVASQLDKDTKGTNHTRNSKDNIVDKEHNNE